MKILHVIQRYWPYTGGSERHLQEISERLVRRGHDVTVVTTDALDLELFWNSTKRRIPRAEEIHNGVRVRRYPVRHLPGRHYAFGAIRRVMAALSDLPLDTSPLLEPLARYVPFVPDLERALATTKERYDLVAGMNICFESLLFPARRLARRQGVPFAIFPLIHLGESERSLVRRFYTMPHQLRLIASADAVLAQTPIEVDYLIGRGVAPGRIALAGAGVNPDEVLGGAAERFRATSGVASRYVLYTGTSAYDKGTVHLVEAMRRVWARDDSAARADLVLVGPVLDPFRAYLDTLSEGERARVHQLGFVEEAVKRDVFAAADVVAMPSRTDSFGIVYLEGWLYGKPVVGARAGGVPAVIDDGENGLLVQFGDVSGLANGLASLLNDPALASRLGENGRHKVRERYTWDRVYPVVEEVYERLCPQPATI